MKQLVGACIIGQSGGPTSVINSSAFGVIEAAMAAPCITRVLGASYGIHGILHEDIVDLSHEDPEELELLKHTPSSFLGSCRYKLKDYDEDPTDYLRILEVFKKYDIRYFFYNGGNDSMDTCNKISNYMKEVGYECRIIGVPKTIDNDLYATDHCPGFASAAKYVATSCMELTLDAKVYESPTICIIEVMGRHAGWLTASTELARYYGYGPDLVYLPEVDFELDSFLDDVERLYRDNGKCIVAVSEGLHDKDGVLIAEYGAEFVPLDNFGHKQLGGLASTLVTLVKKRLGQNIKIRGIELSLLQRCAAHCASGTDVNESYMAGRAAVEFAVDGHSGVMVAFERTLVDGKYYCNIKPVDLALTANRERMVPREWINLEGNGLTSDYLDYILPLVQGEPERCLVGGLPRFAKLKKPKATV